MMLVCALMNGCGFSASAQSGRVTLHQFSKSNYARLQEALGSAVCIKGLLSSDSTGIYFALRPAEYQGIIDPGFSRVVIELDRRVLGHGGRTRPRRHTVCGTLEEATPFDRCDVNECRWYRLRTATLRR